MYGEDISEAYERFIKVNSEVASEIVSIKPKKVHICPSTAETVNKARQDTHKACKTYEDKVTTTSKILALMRLIEGVKEKNLEAILIFIDFKKAFDTVHRGKLLLILKAYGIPE